MENAIYDSDFITSYFKKKLRENKKIAEIIFQLFIPKKNSKGKIPVESLLSFIRKYLVLHLYPIKHYSAGNVRTNTLRKIYEYLQDTVEDTDEIYNSFIEKVNIVNRLNQEIINKGLFCNRLLYECIFWILSVLEKEGIEPNTILETDKLDILLNELNSNSSIFVEIDSHFASFIFKRFSFTACIIEKLYNIDLSVYIGKYDNGWKELIKKEKNINLKTKLDELESLRVTKPDPSRISVDDLIRNMARRRFLVRPSYQRKEVINITKASSIIESLLLDITLPAIFVFKRNDGISEVIDGQQRILAILGFMDKGYIDEEQKQVNATINKFPLKSLRILENLNGKHFEELDNDLQNKILDSKLFIVEIEERLNEHFDPVDLFIRLNNKPYPIRADSFEMWNSWVDSNVIKQLKEIALKKKEWIYIRKLKRPFGDRMLNEELVTILSYFFYKKINGVKPDDFIDIYSRSYRIMARLRDKRDISNVFKIILDDDNEKTIFLQAIDSTKKFLSNLQMIVLDCDKNKEDLYNYLAQELDIVFQGGKMSNYFKRSFQDFYIMWYLIHDLSFSIIKFHRMDIKEQLKELFLQLKTLNGEENDIERFNKMVKDFKEFYRCDSRSMVLTEKQKLQQLRKQKNASGISNAPIFLGDELEVDHIKPLALGGKDVIENMQIVHKTENRNKSWKL